MKTFKRTLSAPAKSFFLFGPRGTGKSTWLKAQFKADLTINLLSAKDFLELQSDPGLLRLKVEALSKGSKVVIDEIQKLPRLLDEVHSLIFDYPGKYQFALTGSSSRKLKQQNANLLAGRALLKSLFTFTTAELPSIPSLNSILKYGMLPQIHNLSEASEKEEFLYSYVDLYLKEEIQQEALVRNLESYHRYLRHAAIYNGQTLNMSNLSRDAKIQRSTADGYFKIVEETLLGFFLPAFQIKAKVKEIAHPKFYFFDTGVVRALKNCLDQDLGPEKGYLFETFLLNEIRAALSYQGKRADLGYWATPSESEIDLIIKTSKSTVGIEMKCQDTWKKEYSRSLNELVSMKKLDTAYGVYTGKSKMKVDGVLVYPYHDFLKKLHQGEIVL